jgi:regulator of RNase E activity RraA
MDIYALKILKLFRKLSTAVLSDALDELKIHGVITGINPLVVGTKIVGPALTVKEKAKKAEISEFRITETLEQAKSGDVLVFDVEKFTEASTWGGLASFSAKKKGIEGVVVNGAVRDVEEIRKMKFPVFARAITPVTGKRRIATLYINVPIEIDEVKISPQDLIVGDENGIIVIPRERVEEVLRIAVDIAGRERKVQNLVIKGRSLVSAEKEVKIRI